MRQAEPGVEVDRRALDGFAPDRVTVTSTGLHIVIPDDELLAIRWRYAAAGPLPPPVWYGEGLGRLSAKDSAIGTGEPRAARRGPHPRVEQARHGRAVAHPGARRRSSSLRTRRRLTRSTFVAAQAPPAAPPRTLTIEHPSSLVAGRYAVRRFLGEGGAKPGLSPSSRRPVAGSRPSTPPCRCRTVGRRLGTPRRLPCR